MGKFDIQNKSGKGHIRIVGEIDWWRNSADQFTRKVDDLLEEGVTDLELYVNTVGGSMFESNEIGNQIKRFAGTKTAKTGALVASSGTIILTYCDKVIAASNMQWMCHDPSQYVHISRLDEWDSNKQLYVNLRNDVINRYHKVTGIAKEELSDMMAKTTWLTAKEAKEKGFVTEVSDEEDTLPEDAKDVFNKSGIAIPTMLAQAFKKTNQNENRMENLAKQYGLPKNASEQQIMDAVQADKDKAVADATKKEGRQTPPANSGKPEEGENSAAMNLLLAAAENKGFDKATVKAAAEKDFDVAANMVNSAPAKPAEGAGASNVRVSDIVEAIQNNGGGSTPKVYDDYSAEELEKMEKENPKEYNKMFNAKFGTSY